MEVTVCDATGKEERKCTMGIEMAQKIRISRQGKGGKEASCRAGRSGAWGGSFRVSKLAKKKRQDPGWMDEARKLLARAQSESLGQLADRERESGMGLFWAH